MKAAILTWLKIFGVILALLTCIVLIAASLIYPLMWIAEYFENPKLWLTGFSVLWVCIVLTTAITISELE